MEILLVEDNESVRQALALSLARAGHTVFAVGSVAEAHEVATKNSLDLVISDIYLPDGFGTGLMRWLRDRGPIPGIAISGDSDPEMEEMCLRSGFAVLLAKPVLASTLDLAIHRLFSEDCIQARKK